jgi:Fe2+/Zn2+ uptake regulation proteins
LTIDKDETISVIDKSWDIESQRANIIKELRMKGCRITAQRKLIIEIILENKCSCCKEIYYEVRKKDPNVGIATVYRMIRTLEDIGAVSRHQVYQIVCDAVLNGGKVYFADDNGNEVEVEPGAWYEAMIKQLISEGYIKGEDITVNIRKRGNHCDNDKLESDVCSCWK